MTSFRSSLNDYALKSTGPKTEAGKRRSRRKAVRHGLTAETVVVAPWKTSKTIKHSKRLSSRRDAVERELVLWLASLLWRMRRASAIETDLFQIQAEILSDRQHEYETGIGPRITGRVIKRFDHGPELKARIPQRFWRSMMTA